MQPDSDVKSIDLPAIPSIDLMAFLEGSEEAQRAIATKVDGICQRIGFLVIEKHGVSRNIIDDAWSAISAFFDLPLDEKLKSKSSDPTCPRGYFPLAAEALAKSLGVDTPPDIKESFGIGPWRAPQHAMADDDREFHYGANLWPASPAGLRESLTDYFDEMETLGARLLRLFAAALALPHDYFDRFHTHPMCALRCIRYPASDGGELPNQMGAGEHSDYGSITVLKPDPRVAGLEIKLPSGEWAQAPLVEDAFIVNIGDMMARWTNDRWVSTLHRVVSPGDNAGDFDRRQSIAFFHNASYDAEIECLSTCRDAAHEPKYESVQAGRYLAERFKSAVTPA